MPYLKPGQIENLRGGIQAIKQQENCIMYHTPWKVEVQEKNNQHLLYKAILMNYLPKSSHYPVELYNILTNYVVLNALGT